VIVLRKKKQRYIIVFYMCRFRRKIQE